MKILVEDIYSKILDPKRYINELKIIREICKARPDGFQFMPKYKKGYWDGYISLMKSMSSFPTGLLGLIVDELSNRDITFEILDDTENIKYSEVSKNDLSGISLRNYQINAANVLLSEKRGVAKMATNSGKTEVMIAMMKALRSKTIVLLHRKELLYQTADRIKSRLETDEVGLIGDGNWDVKDITVAMIQTLDSKKDKLIELEDNKVLFIDECHHASSNRMLDILPKIPGSYRYGFSGTPLKNNVLADLKLMSSTGRVFVTIGNDALISKGYSAVPIVKIHEIYCADEYWGLDYHSAYDELIVSHDYRNELIRDAVLELGGVTLILVERIDHGKILNSMIENSLFVNGSDSTEHRLEVLDLMRSEKECVVIASPIFDEGVDIPNIDNVVIACGGKSNVKLLQRIGRGLRKKEGENILNVVDFMDDTNKHLLNHSEARIDTYIEEGFEIELV